MSRRHRRASGFATYTAIALMILIGTTLVTVGMVFSSDAKRTRSQQAEAQLRQLLTAGALAAMNHLDHPAASTQPTEIALPGELTDAKLTFLMAPGSDAEHRSVTIRAVIGSRHMEQLVRFDRRDGRWQPASASLTAGAPAGSDAAALQSGK
jgi:hypothetical protein